MESLGKMDFRNDDIVVVLVIAENEVIAEAPVYDLAIDDTKNFWRITASPSLFENVEITGPFRGAIINRTVNNTVLISTNLQAKPENLVNDVEISWNKNGLIYLNKL